MKTRGIYCCVTWDNCEWQFDKHVTITCISCRYIVVYFYTQTRDNSVIYTYLSTKYFKWENRKGRELARQQVWREEDKCICLCKTSIQIYIVFLFDNAATIHNWFYINIMLNARNSCMQIRVWLLYCTFVVDNKWIIDHTKMCTLQLLQLNNVRSGVCRLDHCSFNSNKTSVTFTSSEPWLQMCTQSGDLFHWRLIK